MKRIVILIDGRRLNTLAVSHHDHKGDHSGQGKIDVIHFNARLRGPCLAQGRPLSNEVAGGRSHCATMQPAAYCWPVPARLHARKKSRPVGLGLDLRG